MDVHDASADGASDSWIFYGDSITEDGMPHEPVSGSSPNFSQLINAARPAYFPAYRGRRHRGPRAATAPRT